MDLSPAPFDVSVLPGSTHPIVRARAKARRLPESVWRAAAKVGDIKRDVPDAAVPFLIYEYGLEEVAAWVPDLRRVLADGRDWQRIRGTPASIAQALAWVGERPLWIEEDPDSSWWDLFQLALDGPRSRSDLAPIVALTRLSKSSHTDVIRIYNTDYDLRPLLMDSDDTINGAALFNDWSGVYVQDGWPKISFGAVRGEVLAIGEAATLRFGLAVETAAVFVPEHGLIVNGPSEFNGREPINPAFEVERALAVEIGSVADFTGRGPWPVGAWPDGPYGVPEVLFTGSVLIEDVEDDTSVSGWAVFTASGLRDATLAGSAGLSAFLARASTFFDVGGVTAFGEDGGWPLGVWSDNVYGSPSFQSIGGTTLDAWIEESTTADGGAFNETGTDPALDGGTF